MKGTCEILGLDPLYVANEGKLVAVVSPDIAEAIVDRMKSNIHGVGACIIGEVKAEPQGIVDDDRIWRHAHCRHARRRPASSYLLTRISEKRLSVIFTGC